MPEPLTHVGQNPCTQRRGANDCCGIPVKLSGPKALSSSSGYASALVFVYRSGQPFLQYSYASRRIMLRWTHLAAAVALGHACNYPFLRNNSYGCARDPCAALDAVACAAEATCDMSSVGCATACAALNSSQCMYLPANYTLYLITYNMDDITYGPLKCSQEMVMSDDYTSYWYECSGNGTAVSSSPGLDDDGVGLLQQRVVTHGSPPRNRKRGVASTSGASRSRSRPSFEPAVGSD